MVRLGLLNVKLIVKKSRTSNFKEFRTIDFKLIGLGSVLDNYSS